MTNKNFKETHRNLILQETLNYLKRLRFSFTQSEDFFQRDELDLVIKCLESVISSAEGNGEV